MKSHLSIRLDYFACWILVLTVAPIVNSSEDQNEVSVVKRGNGESIIHPKVNSYPQDLPARKETEQKSIKRPFLKLAKGELQENSLNNNKPIESQNSVAFDDASKSVNKPTNRRLFLGNHSKVDDAPASKYKYQLSQNDKWKAVAENEGNELNSKLNVLRDDLENLKKINQENEQKYAANSGVNRNVIVASDKLQNSRSDVHPQAEELLNVGRSGAGVKVEPVRLDQADTGVRSSRQNEAMAEMWRDQHFEDSERDVPNRFYTGADDHDG